MSSAKGWWKSLPKEDLGFIHSNIKDWLEKKNLSLIQFCQWDGFCEQFESVSKGNNQYVYLDLSMAKRLTGQNTSSVVGYKTFVKIISCMGLDETFEELIENMNPKKVIKLTTHKTESGQQCMYSEMRQMSAYWLGPDFSDEHWPAQINLLITKQAAEIKRLQSMLLEKPQRTNIAL